MPKLYSPFVRKSETNWKVTDEVAEGYEWVFEDDSVMAIEKLHGTNVSVIIKGGNVVSVWNRKNRIPIINKEHQYIIEGLLDAKKRGYLELPDGQWFGELIGPKVNGNPYKLNEHRWIPFATFARRNLRYKSWGKYPKTFESISEWFKNLPPLYNWMAHGKEKCDSNPSYGFVEGIVFTHPDGRMAKLRRDMFDWYTD